MLKRLKGIFIKKGVEPEPSTCGFMLFTRRPSALIASIDESPREPHQDIKEPQTSVKVKLEIE